MAIPIKLITASGPKIPLVVNSIDVHVQRQVSAFPIPGTSNRIAIDMNLPQVDIEINGIMADDDAGITALDSIGFSTDHGMVAIGCSPALSRSAIDISDHGVKCNAAAIGDSNLNIFNKKWTHGMGPKVLVGKSVYHAPTGVFLGIIETVNFYQKQGYETLRSFDLVGVTPIAVAHGDRLLIPGSGSIGAMPILSWLHDRFLYLYPNYWRDVTNTPHGKVNSIALAFREDEISNRSTLGGGVAPYLVSGSDKADLVRDILITVPLGGIVTSPTNGNPASTLALLIQDALTISTDIITNGKIHPDGGKKITDAFDTSVHGTVVVVKQRYQNPDNIYEDITDFFSTHSIPSDRSLWLKPRDATPFSNSRKSAGDKVQDLMGIFANSDNDFDLIKGIQIPYDSLITSPNITPVARNFFLTAGKVTPSSKQSDVNRLPASGGMVNLGHGFKTAGDRSDPYEDRDDEFWGDIFGSVGDFAYDLFDFLGSAGETIMATLDRTAVGNQGGMRILPVLFHSKYDAGNQHYVFDLKLIASDFVIGV
jgi:hypothetical protein